MPNVKTTVNIPEADLNKLREIAKRRGIKLTDALIGALKINEVIDDELQKGQEIIIRDPKTEKQRTVLIVQN